MRSQIIWLRAMLQEERRRKIEIRKHYLTRCSKLEEEKNDMEALFDTMQNLYVEVKKKLQNATHDLEEEKKAREKSSVLLQTAKELHLGMVEAYRRKNSARQSSSPAPEPESTALRGYTATGILKRKVINIATRLQPPTDPFLTLQALQELVSGFGEFPAVQAAPIADRLECIIGFWELVRWCQSAGC